MVSIPTLIVSTDDQPVAASWARAVNPPPQRSHGLSLKPSAEAFAPHSTQAPIPVGTSLE